jgi:hypothetical protein
MEWKEIGMATNNHFKICWPAKIPNRDNSEDKGLNMLKAGLPVNTFDRIAPTAPLWAQLLQISPY